MANDYVHGYDPRESIRLQDQASTLTTLLHADTQYASGTLVLEAGCGVGAQTITLACKSPQATFACVDISLSSTASAKKSSNDAGLTNVCFLQGDIFQLPFAAETFDHLFICFVLEHLPNPIAALKALKHLLKKDGSLTVIEGDHGSAYFYPDSRWARQAIQCQVELQRRAGGNALIGRQLYPLLKESGFHSIRVSPRMVYADASRPALVDGFTKKTFTAMIEGVKDSAIDTGLSQKADFDRGIQDLYKTAEEDGVFCYTFFKAVAQKTVRKTA